MQNIKFCPMMAAIMAKFRNAMAFTQMRKRLKTVERNLGKF
uniref:Uncharacterized protein n=1 Tax=uncultured Desulfobacterium sp. TaxID=201089 RepID=E1YJR1_9BACT|nr:unknown protein [uncultured Desulfobacterium sp.]